MDQTIQNQTMDSKTTSKIKGKIRRRANHQTIQITNQAHTGSVTRWDILVLTLRSLTSLKYAPKFPVTLAYKCYLQLLLQVHLDRVFMFILLSEGILHLE